MSDHTPSSWLRDLHERAAELRTALQQDRLGGAAGAGLLVTDERSEWESLLARTQAACELSGFSPHLVGEELLVWVRQQREIVAILLRGMGLSS